ncbi:MAG: CHAT domain-containing protein [Actinomycetota bacterium]
MTDNPTPSITVGGDASGQIAIGDTVTQTQTGNAQGAGEHPITVLFWAANPVNTTQLRLDEEIRTIDERLQASEHRDRFDLRSQWAVRHSDLSEGLLRYRPEVVHFSGHGDPEGLLLFEDDDGVSQPMDIEALADLFRIAGEQVRCVVFNACYSADQASAVAASIDCVVGTTRAIEDPSALAFAAGFYRALGYGQSVQSAFDLGRNEISLAGYADEDVPQLHAKQGVDAADVHIA